VPFGQSGRHQRKTKNDEELQQRHIQGAYSTHEIRKAATEEKIRRAGDEALRKGIKPTQSNIAKLSGLSVRTVKRYWGEFQKR
jgi:hypothetical protein